MKNILQMNNRLPRLQELITRLNNGIDVQRRDLKSILTDSEWEEFDFWWTDEKDKRNLTPPKELIHYIKWKKKVALAYGRYEKYASRPAIKRKSYISIRMEQAAEHMQEKLLEYLNEQLTHNTSLMIWLLPKEPFQTVEDTLRANIPPQVCTSRTVASDKRSPIGKLGKRDLKIKILQQAISSVEKIYTYSEKVISSNLRSKSKKDFKDFKF
jgi:hypothetical protein